MGGDSALLGCSLPGLPACTQKLPGLGEPGPIRFLALKTSPPDSTATHSDPQLHLPPAPNRTTEAMSAPSLAPYILKRPWLTKWVKPLAQWYGNAAGYRQLGLRYGRLPHRPIRSGSIPCRIGSMR